MSMGSPIDNRRTLGMARSAILLEMCEVLLEVLYKQLTPRKKKKGGNDTWMDVFLGWCISVLMLFGFGDVFEAVVAVYCGEEDRDTASEDDDEW